MADLETSPHRRTSINQLLNPVSAHPPLNFPRPDLDLPPLINNPSQPRIHSDVHRQHLLPALQPASDINFSLRAADWNSHTDLATGMKRKSDDDHFERSQRQWIDSSGHDQIEYSSDPKWHHRDVSMNTHYGPGSLLAPMCSDERTPLSGDSPPNNSHLPPPPYPTSHLQIAPSYHRDFQSQPSYEAHHQHTYENSPYDNASYTTPWQTAERASVRIVARESHPQSSQYQQSVPPYQAYPSSHGPSGSSHSHPHLSPPGPSAPHPSYSESPHHPPSKRSRNSPDEPADQQQSQSPQQPLQQRKPKKSRPKSGAEGGTSSKRGYNAKKRSEAALIAAQNAHLMPTVSYTHAPKATEDDKGAMRILLNPSDPHAAPTPSSSGHLHPELQFARCMSNRYKSEQFPRCVSCTRRWAGDTCRFQGIRFFLKDEDRNIVGISFVESQKPDAPSMEFPARWNVKLSPDHIKRTKITVARALLPTLREELQHLNIPDVIRRPRESEVRATCDTCMTSIFSSSWMCRLCGREACAECYKEVKRLTVDSPQLLSTGLPPPFPVVATTLANDTTQPPAAQAPMTPQLVQQQQQQALVRKDKSPHSNPFFLSCTRRNEHQAKDFSPMSRFCKEELAQAIRDMEALLHAEGVPERAPYADVEDEMEGQVETNTSKIDPELEALGAGLGDRGGGAESAPAEVSMSSTSSVSGTGTLTLGSGTGSGQPTPEVAQSALPIAGTVSTSAAQAPFTPVWMPPDPKIDPSLLSTSETDPPPAVQAELPSHLVEYYTEQELTEEVFRPIWERGEPVVVRGLLPKFHIQWTPEYFVEKYQTQSCLIIECQTDENKRVTVGEFFASFGKYQDRTNCYKLKDWPPSSDFKSAFPELYEDFSAAVPIPNYVRRDGTCNIASHFPSNTVAPDIGPKMYNAMASSERPGSKGSTRLHMDMADALNIMLYTAPCPDGSEGTAAWDLFRAEDSEKIRTFLRNQFKGMFQHDPIHSQQIYLDSELRRQLYEEFGVKSYRVYQKPGEAVFIPAGCAHQVCNLSDCIKVAIDFVSPENIDRCEKLTREFRDQNQSMAWKEDILQLRTMMWFAWLSCCRQEKEGGKVEQL